MLIYLVASADNVVNFLFKNQFHNKVFLVKYVREITLNYHENNSLV